MLLPVSFIPYIYFCSGQLIGIQIFGKIFKPLYFLGCMKKWCLFTFVLVIFVYGCGSDNINKGDIPKITSQADSPFAIHDPFIPEADKVSDVAQLGAGWVRYAGRNGIVWDVVEQQKGQFDWMYYDQIYLETSKNNIKMFVSILPANHWDRLINQQKPEQLPKDMEAYKNFLRKTVERYDGDGIDDAPGSPVVDVWQISNELDLFWNGNPTDYARLLKESYKAIKQANPQAQVAIAGVGTPRGFDGITKFYVPLMEELAKIRDNPGDRYFDVFDFHWYPFDGQYNYLRDNFLGKEYATHLKDYIKNINSTLTKYNYNNIPIFITETGQYSGTPSSQPPAIVSPEFNSERKQALDLYKIYVYSLANGVKKIFWVTLTEWHDFGSQPNGVFDNVGLINNPQNDGQSHKKLAYYTYKKMVEVLDGSDWSNIQTIQEKDGIYIYKFTKQGKPIWVAWNDNPQEKQITISGINSDQVVISESVPKYESGKEVVDYDSAFRTEKKAVQDGQITIPLGENPLFIK
jgi:hypothetical protein